LANERTVRGERGAAAKELQEGAILQRPSSHARNEQRHFCNALADERARQRATAAFKAMLG
jgi:hypothetical protein